MNWKLKYRHHLLIGVYTLLNFIQSMFTELANDEAYYWMYSNFLDWGYFDHPPAIAFIIKIGYGLFKNELGVRLMVVILNSSSLYLLREIIGRKYFGLLFLLFCSISSLQVYSFIAVPDSPLLFTTCLFFYAYQRFLDRNILSDTLLLGMSMALLMYSKYHGILIIFFTMASNRKLIMNPRFIVAGISALLLYAPHLNWQVMNDFPSYQFHVLNRSQSPYDYMDTTNFLLGQFLITGPFMTIPLLYRAIRWKSEAVFDKSLRYTMFGIFLFFLFSTANDHAEANWTISACIPMILLAHHSLTKEQVLTNWLVPVASLSILALLFVRLHLMFDLLPNKITIKDEFHGSREWATEIKHLAASKSVIFMNSYQDASKYSFYSGDMSLSLNNVFYRRNQFDLWPISDSMQGLPAIFFTTWDYKDIDSIETAKGIEKFIEVPSFYSANRVWLSANWPKDGIRRGQIVEVTFEFMRNQNLAQGSDIDANPLFITYEIFQQEEYSCYQIARQLSAEELSTTNQLTIPFRAPNKAGTYFIILSIRCGNFPASINSKLYRVKVI
ncbi:MAG: glycosyltransferase family 39 protein [Vicingaceae bacterium]